MKIREILKRLSNDGWYITRTRESHRQLKHTTKTGTVTVAGKLSIDIPAETLKSFLKQS